MKVKAVQKLAFHRHDVWRQGILALSLCLLAHSLEAQAPTQTPTQAAASITSAQLEKLCREGLEAFKVPGLAVGVIKDGQVVLSKGFGVRKLEPVGKTSKMAPAAQVDENTLFAIASNTKAFVGLSMAMLAHDGKVGLEDKVMEHLPYLEYPSKAVTELANVTDLLTHRIGLGTFKGDQLWFKRNVSPREVLTKVKYMELEYPFRAGYGYSNLGFIAAGEVIAKVSGQTWDAFAKTHIWSPLDMQRTVAHIRDFPDQNFAYGHITRQSNSSVAPVPWENSGAAGGIWSTSEDMLHWLEANLSEGIYHGDTLWPASVQRNVWKPRNVFGNMGDFSSYGLGWFMADVEGYAIASHGGGYDGMYSQVIAVPELKLGIVVLSNSMTALPSSLAKQITGLYLGVAKSDWIEKALAKESKGNEEWFAGQDSVDQRLAGVQGKPNQVVGIEGNYEDQSYGTFLVSKVADGRYKLEFPRANLMVATLAPVGADQYRITWNEQHAWFDRGSASFATNTEGKLVLRLYIPNDDIFYDEIAAVKK